MARPTKAVKKTSDLHIRFDPSERAMLDEKAALSGMTVSDYMRRAALGKRIYSKEKYQVIAEAVRELSRLGRLQKYLAMKDPAYKKDYKALFLQISEQVQKVGDLFEKADKLP